MASRCICIIVITIVCMFSLVVCKPFLGDLLARAIASSSTPDDPQSHITDFRVMSKMDTKADKLKVADAGHAAKMNKTSATESEPLSAIELPESTESSSIMSLPASTLWQSWNRTKILSRLVDDIVRPVHERITLVFRTLVAGTDFKDNGENEPEPTSELEKTADKNTTDPSTDDDSEELVSEELELLLPENEPALIIDPATNGSTLLGQFQARRNMLRRRVAKALSSITGLLILAADSRRKAKARSRRSPMESSTDGPLLGDRPGSLDVLNEIDTYDDDGEQAVTKTYTPDDDSVEEATPRRNFESIGIFILEVFGSIAGFSWGIFKQVQSLFSY